MTNEALMTDLEAWASQTAMVDPRSFGCTFHASCSNSTGDNLSKGGGCVMSYLGRHYANNALGTAFRLMIVGLDQGRYCSATYRESQVGIEEAYVREANQFNDHYAGVVKTAAAVLGQMASDCGTDCANSRTCRKARGDVSARCVIERIMQPNIVKCVRADRPPTSMSYNGTTTMEANCTNHLIDEIRLANPNLVIFHGACDRKPALTWLRRHRYEVVALAKDGSGKDLVDRHGPVLFAVPPLRCHMLFLYHPSYGWLDKQWRTVVIPAIEHMREKGIIPI